MAIGANFNLDFILCRTHGKRVAAGAGYDCIRVPLGMNIGFHARIIAQKIDFCRMGEYYQPNSCQLYRLVYGDPRKKFEEMQAKERAAMTPEERDRGHKKSGSDLDCIVTP